MGDREPTYRSGAAFAALSFFAMLLVGVGGAIAIARVYGIGAVGEFALVYVPTGAVWWLSSTKEQAALVRELASLPPRSPRVTGLFAAVFTFSTALTLAAVTIAAGISWWAFRGPLDNPDLYLPAVATLLSYALFVNPGWNLDTIFSSFLAGRALFWIRLHQGVVNLVAGIVLGLAWPTVWSLVGAFALSSATSLLHRAVAVRRYMRYRVPRAEVREGFRRLPGIVKFGLKMTPGMIFQGISNEFATWTLGAMGSVAAVGAYNRAWTLGRRLQELNWRIGEMLLPALAQRWGGGDRAGFDRVLVDTLRYSAGGMLLIGAAGGGAASGVMDLFGSGFDQADAALAIILLMPAVGTLSTLQSQALVAQGRPLATTYAAGGRVVATVVATIVLVDVAGVTGAALGMILGFAVDLVWKTVLVRRTMTTPVHAHWPVRQAVGLVAAFAAGFGVARALDATVGGVAGVGAGLFGGSLAYVSVLVVVGGLTDSDRRRLKDLNVSLRQRASRRATATASAGS